MPSTADDRGGHTLSGFAASLMPGGQRTDNLFKFLAGLTDDAVAEFLSGLFAVVGRVVDGDDTPSALEAFLLDREEAARAAAVRSGRGPRGLPPEPLDPPALVALRKPLREARVALLSSGAIRREKDKPYIAAGYTYEAAVASPQKAWERVPELRILPADVDARGLLVEHIAYDVRAARRDVNVIFPIERLRELSSEGVIGGVADEHYAFSGLTDVGRLAQEIAPIWARRIAASGADAVVLTPG